MWDFFCENTSLRKTVVYLDTKNTKPWHPGFLRSQSCVFVTLNCACLSGKMRKSTLTKKKTDLCLYNTYQRRTHRTVLMKCFLVCRLHNIISLSENCLVLLKHITMLENNLNLNNSNTIYLIATEPIGYSLPCVFITLPFIPIAQDNINPLWCNRNTKLEIASVFNPYTILLQW